MKKVLIFSAIVIFALTACKKEDVGDVNNAQQTQSKRIEALILKFKDKLENNLKDGTTYAADSATWYVEALLNYEQANNAHNFTGLEFYKDSVLLNSTNGEIPIQELDDAYSYFNGVIATILQQANDPLLNVDLIDVSFDETGLKDGTVEMELVVSTGKGSSINYTLFPDSADWYWGDDLGACGDNNSGDETDAADKLEYKFNHPISVGQSGWFTGVVDIWLDGYDYPDNSYPGNPGPHCNKMIFLYDPDAIEDPPCIEHEELNYYLSKFDYIKADTQPTGKTFKTVDVLDYSSGTGSSVFYWYWYVMYYGAFSENPH